MTVDRDGDEGGGEQTVRAAGGVVWRQAPAGGTEVLLVHRPKYDDWSFPKGKVHAGEEDEAAALREVEEETGLHCSLGDELPSSFYRDAAGRPKVVRYWSMEPVDGLFAPNQEVDEALWVPVDDAPDALSYGRDREVLSSFTG